MAILKQQKLLELILENNGKPASQQLSMRQLIFAAGYSEGIADNPKAVLESKSWEELKTAIPKDEIFKKIVTNALQTRSIHGSNNALDMVLKIISGYAPTKLQVSTEEEPTDEELEQKIAEAKRQIAEQEGRNSSLQDENGSKQVTEGSKQVETDENNSKTE